jgi:Methyltransferase domain
LPEDGIGFLDWPVPKDFYGADYFSRYLKLDRTRTGERLTELRRSFVARHWRGTLTDIGIGGGGFVKSHGNATGWDVNVHALRWLHDEGLLLDPRVLSIEAATFWDSIEHMRDPSLILNNVTRWAFISTPIYQDARHAVESKHYKPGEHLWYFSEHGLHVFMKRLGFKLREANAQECECGREDIGSFAFERI